MLPEYAKTKSLAKLLTLFLIAASVGCRPLKNLNPATYPIDPVGENSFSKLDGRYYNVGDTGFGRIRHVSNNDENNINLLDQLFIHHRSKPLYTGVTVELKFLTSKKAVVTTYRERTVLFTKHIRGKFKDGYLYVRPKAFIIPLPPLLYVQDFRRARIGKAGADIIPMANNLPPLLTNEKARLHYRAGLFAFTG